MQKRWLSGCAVLVAGLLLVCAAPAKASTQDFEISSFTADYYVSRDADHVAEMRITETIVADFPAINQNHGIERAIPQVYNGHSLELHVRSVKKASGSDWAYSAYEQNDNQVLRIGDADVYVHGKQTYVIDYTVRGVANEPLASEIFWDVNGDQWPQAMGEVVARVHFPKDIASNLQGDQKCYAGTIGSLATQCDIYSSAGADGGVMVTVRSQRPLQPYETLSFELPVEPGTFAPYKMSASLLTTVVLIGIVETLPTIAALIIVIRNWRRYGKDAKGRGVVVSQYLPPKDIGVIGSGIILKQKFEPATISATIIDLAVRHYLKVYETGKKVFGKYTYDLELVKNPDGLLAEERAVITMLFDSSAPAVGSRISLDTLSNKMYVKAAHIGESVTRRVTTQGLFVMNPQKARRPYYIAGAVLLVGGILFPPYTLGFVPAGLICLVGAVFMAAVTLKGAAAKEYLRGLEMYMKLAEADRLKVLQSPHGELTEKIDITNKGQVVKLYERLLPYAMLFGIEKDWAKQFAHLYDRAPDWYSGTSTFNAVYFASAVHGLGVATASSFSPPSSSGAGGGAGGGW